MAAKTVRQWLESQGLGQYLDAFRENDIDSRAIPYLNEQDLRELGVSLGHRRVLLAAIQSLEPDEIIDSEEIAGGRRPSGAAPERRQLSVMFCDIVGSTELTRQMDPEDMREVLREYQDLVGDAVRKYQGYIARFVGDGILAYFGWPQAYEDQAERAVRAGLEAAIAVTRIDLGDGQHLAARFGIDSGEVVVGDLVGEETSDVETVTGLSPNLAARLQGIAQPGQVVIGADTRNLLGGTFEMAALGEHAFKGFPEAVTAWAVLREREAETRFEAVRGSSTTGLVGRDHELGLLCDRWELAREGEGQVVLLSGEAGIGKSRMVQSFIERSEKTSRFNLHYQCSPYHTNSAFYPVIQRLQRAARFAAGDSSEERLAKLEQLLKVIGQADDTVASLFAALLSLPLEERFGDLDLTPQQLRQRTVEVLNDQMLHLAKRRPVLCVVEDAHWIDPSTAEFVAELIPRVTDHPVFLLVTYRPENAPRWSGHPHKTSITLNRLGRKQAARIAQSVGGQELMDVIIDRIVSRADGVPLYIEELTKTVIEAYSANKEPGLDDLIPATLQSSLIARLDYLEEARNVAQVGAVIGREFSYSLIEEIADLPREELDAALERLVDSGLVFTWGRAPHSHYTFKHALIHDAAYKTILIKRRQQLHRHILAALEKREKDTSPERLDALAHHAFCGQAWDRAFHYYQLAGRRSMDQAAIREAVAQFEHALEAAQHLPETTELLEQGLDLRFDLRNALWSIAAFEAILDNLKKAEQVAAKLEDERRKGWISVFSSASMWQLGRTGEALEAAHRALEINRDISDLPLEVGACFYLGCATVTTGHCRQAESYFGRIVDLLKGDMETERCGLPFVPSVISRSWLVWALAERGEFEKGAHLGEEALAIAKSVGHPFNLAHIYYDLGYYYQVRGQYRNAVEALENAMHFVREFSLTYLSPFICGFLGHSCALAGEVDRGVKLLRQAVADYDSMGLGLFRSLVRIQLAEGLLLAGDLEEARAALHGGLELATRRGEEGHEAWARRLQGEIFLAQDSGDQRGAEECFRKALRLAEKHDMRPLQAHCFVGLAKLNGGPTASDRQTELSDRATRLVSEIGMEMVR